MLLDSKVWLNASVFFSINTVKAVRVVASRKRGQSLSSAVCIFAAKGLRRAARRKSFQSRATTFYFLRSSLGNRVSKLLGWKENFCGF